jgi:hypothetical protein
MTLANDQARRTRIGNILSSPRLALSLLLFLAVFIGTVSWFPWTLDRTVQTPGWASATGLDRPFSSLTFLVAVFLLFVNTVACTVERTNGSWKLLNGVIPQRGKMLDVKGDDGFIDFLNKQGFRTTGGPPYFKNRFALTKGWLFHVGLVILIAGVLVQQANHDSGSFEIGEGEMVRLSDAGVIFGRDTGLLAPSELPSIQLALEQFDPYLHQKGYAPDRASTLIIRTRGGEQRVILDRARGVTIEGLSIYQAIPFGLTLNVEITGLGMRSLHFREESPKRSDGEFRDPSGGSVRFSVEAERNINDPLGTGKLVIFLVQGGTKTEINIGQPFAFGDRTAKIISLSRWAGFTYSRSPGVSFVFTGFFLLLIGTAIMLVPAGIVTAGAQERPGTMRVYLSQGADDFTEDWYRFTGAKVL